MNITLFTEITTESALRQLEADGEKYTGLYVDMNAAEQRKYVKNSAVMINDLIKKLDRSRIDQKKAHNAQVEAEAKAIRERLEAANAPFTQLIDAYKHERALILAEQKANDEAMALALQVETDHETALLMDKVQTIEAAERAQAKLDYEAEIAAEATHRAVEAEQRRQKVEAERIENERLGREANKAHVSSVRTAAKLALIDLGVDEVTAIMLVRAIHKGQIPAVTISY